MARLIRRESRDVAFRTTVERKVPILELVSKPEKSTFGQRSVAMCEEYTSQLTRY